MSLKHSLILLTLVSVVCDTMVLPFYPQFLAQSFAVTSAAHTGYYIAACCATVMLMFPLWAKVARHINEVHLWVYTQIIAGILGVSCYFVGSLTSFWVLSQLMLVFKASYLLIYPFVMRLEQRDTHLNMAGLFSVLMHFGAIGGAMVGGIVLEWFQPRFMYLIMALGDLIQVMVCLYLIRRFSIERSDIARSFSAKTDANSKLKTGKNKDKLSKDGSSLSRWFERHLGMPDYVIQIGILSLLFYFAAFAIRPFLSSYWLSIAAWNSTLLAGFVYAIPAWMAIIGLWLNARCNNRLNSHQRIALAMGWVLVGSLIQAAPIDWVMVLGRIIYGWGLFQVMVGLEVLLFQASKEYRFAHDYSRVHMFQNIGLIFASFTAGYLVALSDLRWPFYLSALIFVLTLVTFLVIYRCQLFHSNATRMTTEPESAT